MPFLLLFRSFVCLVCLGVVVRLFVCLVSRSWIRLSCLDRGVRSYVILPRSTRPRRIKNVHLCGCGFDCGYDWGVAVVATGVRLHVDLVTHGARHTDPMHATSSDGPEKSMIV